MGNCVICQEHSGRMEICFECALVLWGKQTINPGAKVLAGKLMPVPEHPAPVLAGSPGSK